MKVNLIYLSCILFLVKLSVLLSAEIINGPKASANEVTTYNDFLKYLFGTNFSKSDPEAINATVPKKNGSKKFVCNPRNLTSNQTIQVHLITLTTKGYLPMGSKSNIEMVYKNNECVLLLLYFAWCPHSVKIAPFYNAVGRSYPQLHVMAMNSYNHNGVNLRLSLFGVPSIILLQNGQIVARFNETEINLNTLKQFITNTTSFEPLKPLELVDADLLGPVPTKVEEQFDYLMFLAIVFLLFTFVYFVRTSRVYVYLLETIRSTWLESQQREHLD